MDYQALVNSRNERNLFAKRVGALVTEISQGYARVEKTVEPDDANPVGVPHGGGDFTMADNACGSAMATHGCMAVTVNASYNFFRSARVGDHLTAEAREVKTGRTVCVYDVRLTNQDDVLLGTGTFTFYKLDQKLEV